MHFFALKCGCDCNFKDNEFNLTKSKYVNPPYIRYSGVNLSLEEQQELLEKFYRGEIVVGKE